MSAQDAPERVCSAWVERCARTIHEARRALCDVLRIYAGPTWLELSESRRECLCEAVRFQIDHPETDGRRQYELFSRQARDRGFTGHLAFDALPPAVQAEYAIVPAIVRELLG